MRKILLDGGVKEGYFRPGTSLSKGTEVRPCLEDLDEQI